MDSFMHTVQTNAIVQAILFIVLGLVLLVVPDLTIVTVVYCIGVVFAISGAVSLAAYYRKSSPSYQMGGALSMGIFLLVIALIMFIFPAAVAGFFTVLLGLVLILCGVVNTVRALGLRAAGAGIWVTNIIIGILVAIGGVIIIWNPFETTVMLVQVLGILFIVTGISDLLVELGVRKRLANGR